MKRVLEAYSLKFLLGFSHLTVFAVVLAVSFFTFGIRSLIAASCAGCTVTTSTNWVCDRYNNCDWVTTYYDGCAGCAPYSCPPAYYPCNYSNGSPGNCCPVSTGGGATQCYCHRTPAGTVYRTADEACKVKTGGIISEYEYEYNVAGPYFTGQVIQCGITGNPTYFSSHLYCNGVQDAWCSGWYQETSNNYFNAPISGWYGFHIEGSGTDILSMDLDGSNTEPPHNCSGADNYVGLYTDNHRAKDCYLMNMVDSTLSCSGNPDQPDWDGDNAYQRVNNQTVPNWNPAFPPWWGGNFMFNIKGGYNSTYDECIIGQKLNNGYPNKFFWSRRYLTKGLHKMYQKGTSPVKVWMAGTSEQTNKTGPYSSSDDGPYVSLTSFATCPITSCDCQCVAPPAVAFNPSSTNANGVTTVSWNAPANWGTECGGSQTQQYGYCFGRTSGACDIAEVKTTGTSATVSIASGQWYLTVKAYNKCGSFSTAVQSVYVNSPPTITVTTLTTPTSATLPVEAIGGVNSSQTCEPSMGGGQTLNVSITGNDTEGGSDIASIEMKILRSSTGDQLGSVYSATGVNLAVSGTTAKATFANIDLSGYLMYKNVDIYARVTDKTGATTGWIMSRRVRVWDCKVAINGEVYDSSSTGTSCNATPPVGYTLAADDKMNFKNATFTNNGTTVDAPATSVSTFGPATVTWGLTYTTALNSDLNGGSPQARWEGVGNFQCNNQATLNSALANPYTDNPTIVVKYSVLRNQDPWYQVTGAGVRAGGKVYDPVPPTCTGTCINAISKQDTSGYMNNGLVAATNITSGLCTTGCTYGKPNNLYSMVNPIGKKYGYDYFYGEVYAKMGIGTTFNRQTSFSELPTRGVVFVDGDLTVNSSSLTPVAKKQYLLVVVRGNIIVNPGVNLISGIFVTSGDFVTKKNNTDTALTIDGVVYAHGSTKLGTGFNNAVKNNNLPGVTVNYRPDFIFALPGSIASKLANWQETAN